MKLCIYIPTFNRPVALRRLLDSLLFQTNKFESNVRVLINDNNSDNNVNDNILEEYESFKTISYRKNSSNIGANANMNLGFIFAHPDEYLWILGDDDYLEPNALDYIFCNLKQDPDLILFSNTMENLETSYSIKKSYEEWLCFWVSTNLFKMSTFSNYAYSTFYFHNTSYPHIAIQWTAQINHNLVIEILPIKYILNRTVSNENNTGENYSLAWTGALGLSEILEQKDSELFVKYWLSNYGINYFKNEKYLKSSFEFSKLLIFKLSLRVKTLYFKTKFRYLIFDTLNKFYSNISDDKKKKINNLYLYKKVVKIIKNKNTISK